MIRAVLVATVARVAALGGARDAAPRAAYGRARRLRTNDDDNANGDRPRVALALALALVLALSACAGLADAQGTPRATTPTATPRGGALLNAKRPAADARASAIRTRIARALFRAALSFFPRVASSRVARFLSAAAAAAAGPTNAPARDPTDSRPAASAIAGNAGKVAPRPNSAARPNGGAGERASDGGAASRAAITGGGSTGGRSTASGKANDDTGCTEYECCVQTCKDDLATCNGELLTVCPTPRTQLECLLEFKCCIYNT